MTIRRMTELVFASILLSVLTTEVTGSDDPLINEGIADTEDASSSRAVSSQRQFLPNPIPPSLLLKLLQSGQLQPPAPMPSAASPQRHAFNEDDDGEKVAKRFLCNRFTGCGGRYRRRHTGNKRLIPGLLKRPFCNSFGCFNAKRGPMLPVAPARAAGTAKQVDFEDVSSKRDAQKGGAEGERSLCNGNGDCRSDKRSLFSPWMSKMSSVADGGR